MGDLFTIEIGSRRFKRFIVHPLGPRDGTLRCIACGQIDDEPWHEREYCPALGGRLPLTEHAKTFLEANAASPVVFGSAYPGRGAYYRLKDGRRFRLTIYDVRSLPMPKWDLPA